MRKEFLFSFQISKTVIFEVCYYTLGGNRAPYFSTSACKFNQPKTDYQSGGQAQKTLLPTGSVARKFYTKWDVKHLQDLSDIEYTDLVADLKELMGTYNYVVKWINPANRPYNPSIPFWRSKELSMMKLPNSKNPAQECK